MINWRPFVLLMTLWVGSLLLAVWRGGFSSWFLLYSFSGLAVYSLLTLLFSLQRIEVSRTVSGNRFAAGDDVVVTLSVKHRSGMPLAWMVVKDRWVREPGPEAGSHRKMLFPWFRSHFTYQYKIRNLERGNYRFHSVDITAGDLFGFATKTKNAIREQSVTVYPRGLEVRRGPESFNGLYDGKNPIMLLTSGSIPEGVREYAEGDPLNRIHWKSTARTGSLKTKQTAPAIVKDMFVVLDGRSLVVSEAARYRPSFETCVEAAAGLLQYAFRNRTGFGFMYTGAGSLTLPFSFQPPKLETGMDLLARAGFMPGTFGNPGSASQLPQELLLLPRQVAVVWVTNLLDELLVEQLKILRGQGRKTQLVLVRGNSGFSWQERQGKRQLERIGCDFSSVACPPAAMCPKAGVEDVGA